MEYFLEILNQYSEQSLYLGIALIFFATSLGVFPGNTDLFMGLLGVLSGKAVVSPLLAIPIVCCSLLLGESTMYLLGKKFGPKIWDRLSEKKRSYLQEKLQRNRTSAILTFRVTPFLRPLLFLSLGSITQKGESFFRIHIPSTVCYVSLMILGFYQLNEIFEELQLPEEIILMVPISLFLLVQTVRVFNKPKG